MKSKRTQSWIYKCLMTKKSEASNIAFTEEDIEEFTDDFLLDLRSVFDHFLKAFNDLKCSLVENVGDISTKESKNRIKGSLLIYDLVDNKGFMLFRKGYRLIFSYVQPGWIKIQFLKQQPLGKVDIFVDTSIRAVTSDTMSINWVHENHKGFVDLNVMARYYMKKFLQEN